MSWKYPILHCLMRDDLDSLNPGKAIAQGMHAANDFEVVIENLNKKSDEKIHTIHKAVELWRGNRTFGTVHTRAARPSQIEKIAIMTEETRFVGGAIIDDTYPLRDGLVMHHIPLLTCGWVFTFPSEQMTASDERVIHELRKLSLYE